MKCYGRSHDALFRDNDKKTACACSIQRKNIFLIIFHLQLGEPEDAEPADRRSSNILSQSPSIPILSSLCKSFADLALEMVAGNIVHYQRF